MAQGEDKAVAVLEEAKVDLIGIETGTTETLKPAGGLLIIGGWIAFTRLVRPRLAAAQRERQEEEAARQARFEEEPPKE